MTPEQIKELNKGRFTFRSEHSSTTAAPYRRHVGHVLVEDFLVPYYPMELSDLSRRARIPLKRLQKLIRGQTRVDKGLAKKLGDFYKNGSDFWLTLQERYERGEKI